MKRTAFFGFAAAALLLAGCTNVASFDYAGSPGTLASFQEAGAGRKTVAVMPFLDQRSAYLHPEQMRDSGSFYWGFLPLFPFGWVTKQEPENSEDFVSLGRFHFDVRNDLAAAAQISLKSSNLFAGVVRANNLEQAAADYIWRGRVTDTGYRGNMYSYCISYFFSPVLWVLGAPMGTSFNDLGVIFELVDRQSGKVVWSYEYHDGDHLNHWLYARYGQDTNLYPMLMKRAMNGALNDLSQKGASLL